MFFLAPTGIALIPLTLLAQNQPGLGSVWHDPAGASAASLADLAEILAERSPGTRDPDALYSIKPERVAALTDLADILPHERVLSVVRDRPSPGLGDPGLAAFDPADPLASLFPDSPLAFGMPGLTVPGLLAGIPADGGTPGSGGGGSPGSGNSGTLVPILPDEPAAVAPPPVVAEVASPVPEPSTWLMNIVGFFAIAGVLRRRAMRNMALGPA